MAVYYKWIKGCESGAGLDKGSWTYIKWGTAKDKTTADLTKEVMPTIFVNSNGKNDTEHSFNLGHILSEKTPTPTITNLWKFNAGFSIGNSNIKIWEEKTNQISFGSGGNSTFKFFGTVSATKQLETVDLSAETINTTDINATNEIQTKSLYAGNNTKTIIKDDISTNSLTITTTIKAGSYCEAVYFNATSDRRAKENITLAEYSALKLINSLPVYNYNYKNSDETVTGIMAQDLLKIQPKELDLVSNIQATGENGDYMSIKNDKLMYVLLKAIQEQQKEIEDLKNKIKNLEK